MKSFVPQSEEEFEKAENNEFNNVLRNSNFNPAYEVVVDEEVAAARLLQNIDTAATKTTIAPVIVT